jgi:hypothetical protein
MPRSLFTAHPRTSGVERACELGAAVRPLKTGRNTRMKRTKGPRESLPPFGRQRTTRIAKAQRAQQEAIR